MKPYFSWKTFSISIFIIETMYFVLMYMYNVYRKECLLNETSLLKFKSIIRFLHTVHVTALEAKSSLISRIIPIC